MKYFVDIFSPRNWRLLRLSVPGLRRRQRRSWLSGVRWTPKSLSLAAARKTPLRIIWRTPQALEDFPHFFPHQDSMHKLSDLGIRPRGPNQFGNMANYGGYSSVLWPRICKWKKKTLNLSEIQNYEKKTKNLTDAEALGSHSAKEAMKKSAISENLQLLLSLINAKILKI